MSDRKIQYVDGTKHNGTIALVGDFDTVNAKTVLRLSVEGPYGALPGVLWLDKTDGKTVNGVTLPSSFDRANELCKYLCGHPLSPSTKHLMAARKSEDRKPVEFTVASRVTNNGNTVFDAKFIQVPQGLKAYNAPSASQLALLFGTTDPGQQTLPGHSEREEPEAPKAPGDNEVPF